MKKHINLILASALFCMPFGICANTLTIDEVKRQLNNAIERIKNTKKHDWVFELHSYENEEGDITEYTAKHSVLNTKDSPWQLLTWNGQPATDKQARKFCEQRQENKNSLKLNLSELINFDTIKVISVSEQHTQLAFSVNIKRLGDDAKNKLKGTLTFYPDREFISHIHITNTDNFSPITLSSIDAFSMQLSFIELQGHVLPKQAKLDMQGTFAKFVKIKETSTDTYSHYTYIGK